MKRFNIFIISLLAVILVSCSSQNSPKGVVKAYFKNIQNEEFYEAAKLMYPEGESFSVMDVADALRGSIRKSLKKFSVLGVQEISDKEALVAVRLVPRDEAAGEELQFVPVALKDGKWYIGKLPASEKSSSNSDSMPEMDD